MIGGFEAYFMDFFENKEHLIYAWDKFLFLHKRF